MKGLWLSLSQQARSFAVWTIGTIAVLATGALLIAWSGLYNVAASTSHFAVTRAFLEFAMRRSVGTQSFGISAPGLDNEDMVVLGAGHYAAGCAPCHGTATRSANPIPRAMLPPPPALSSAIAQWRNAELFWIVKHGIKYAGMPAWTTQRRDDEVWAVVAFLRRLPQLDQPSYLSIVSGNVPAEPASPDALIRSGAARSSLTACARCHGDERRGPVSALVPALAGQSEFYLAASLHAYRNGSRESGFMQPVAAELTDTEITALARYYATLDRPPPETQSKTHSELGRRLVGRGDPKRAIPSCISCHGQSASPMYPRLSGLSANYIASQLRLWKSGLRSSTPLGRVMASIAQRLSEDDIEAVAKTFAARTRTSGAGAP